MYRKYTLSKVIPIFVSLIISFWFCSTAFASTFSGIVFFGDSLSDVGNFGPFGQPPNWTTDLANKYGYDDKAFLYGGENYAFGGAQSDTIWVEANVALIKHLNKLDRDALYSIWGGANDIIHKVPANPDQARDLAINGSYYLAKTLTTLHGAGAQYFLLGNVPDLAYTPYAHRKQLTDSAREAAITYNRYLLQTVNNIGFDVIQVDDFRMFDYFVNHAKDFGFTHPYYERCDNQASCSGYIFYDELHPTAAGYQIIADYNSSVIDAPNYFGYLAETPFSIGKNHVGTINSQLFQEFILNDLTKSHLILSGNVTPRQQDPYENNQNNNHSDGAGGLIGGFIPLGENYALGAAYGYTKNSTELVDNIYKYDTSANTFSLFSDYHYNRFYLNGIADFSLLKFMNIDRSPLLGINRMLIKGNTDGEMYGFDLNSGYLLNLANTAWHTGPVLNANYQSIHVNGYTEEADADQDFLKLVYQSQNNDSLITGIGWQTMFQQEFDAKTFFSKLALTGNHEWLDNKRLVRFHVYSMDGSHASIPVTTGSSSDYYLDIDASIGLVFGGNWSTSLGYTGMFGSHHLQNNTFNLAITKNW